MNDSLYKSIDRNAPEICDALERSPVYRKFGYIHARYAKPREKVATILPDGKTETFNIARRGDWVIINPSGETEIISGEKFRVRYEKIDDSGVYASKGFIKAVKNPYGQPIEILSAWGFPQKGGADCMRADTLTERGELSGEVYLIDGKVFNGTYSVYEKE